MHSVWTISADSHGYHWTPTSSIQFVMHQPVGLFHADFCYCSLWLGVRFYAILWSVVCSRWCTLHPQSLTVLMAEPSALLPSWDAVTAVGREWSAPRAPQDGDVPLVFYRDSNSWCHYCMRVWFALEQKGLRYHTVRVPIGDDPREPAKPQWYLDMVPTACVPALRIGKELIWESIDILLRLEEVFGHRVPLLPTAGRERATALSSFATVADRVSHLSRSVDAWLANTRHGRELSLRNAAHEQLAHIESALSMHGGPFFLGTNPSLVDAVCVGKLQQLRHRLPFFKGFGLLEDCGVTYPRLVSWFLALEDTLGFTAVKQDAAFDQRVYQSHPARREESAPFLRLGPAGSLVGEPSDCAAAMPMPEAGPLVAGSGPALEAAWRLSERRQPLAGFLLRKQQEMGRAEWWTATALPESQNLQRELSALDGQLQGIAAVLAGLVDPRTAAAAVGGSTRLLTGPISQLSRLIGTPRDMTAAAAAQVRAAMMAMYTDCGNLPEMRNPQLLAAAPT